MCLRDGNIIDSAMALRFGRLGLCLDNGIGSGVLGKRRWIALFWKMKPRVWEWSLHGHGKEGA